MPVRSAALQTFIDAAEVAFTSRAIDERSKVSVSRCFATLRRAQAMSPGAGSRLPVCDNHLDAVTDPHRFRAHDLAALARAFRSIEPTLTWGPRKGPSPGASATYKDGHANAMVIGPGGLERRTDVWIGVSLLAPHVRYPDHAHPPEETYLVLSEGEFSQDDGPWFTPGVGGTFHNTPNIRHAMRSGPAPLFAFWLLRPD